MTIHRRLSTTMQWIPRKSRQQTTPSERSFRNQARWPHSNQLHAMLFNAKWISVLFPYPTALRLYLYKHLWPAICEQESSCSHEIFALVWMSSYQGCLKSYRDSRHTRHDWDYGDVGFAHRKDFKGSPSARRLMTKIPLMKMKIWPGGGAEPTDDKSYVKVTDLARKGKWEDRDWGRQRNAWVTIANDDKQQ